MHILVESLKVSKHAIEVAQLRSRFITHDRAFAVIHAPNACMKL
jgi:hypothetical protein